MEDKKRNQFTFYRSYYEALKELPPEDAYPILMAVMEYALDGKEPELTGVQSAVYKLIQPVLDSGRNKALNRLNKTKSNEKQTKNKTRTSQKQTKNKQEQTRKEKEGEKESEREGDKERENDSSIPPTPSIKQKDRSPVLRDAINKWLKYKAERKQKYEPTSLETLMKKIDKAAEQYGEAAVIRLIDDCIANHYQGIIWDRLNQQPARKGKQPAVTEAENQARLQKDLEWLEKFSASGG